MRKHDSFSPAPPRAGRQLGLHPAWYVAGTFFMILVPLLSYGIAELLFQQPDLLPQLTQILYGATDLYARPGQLLYFGDRFFYIKLIIAASLTLVLYALFAFVTFLVNSMFGASRYGPYDLPPVAKPRGVRVRKAR